MSCLRPCHVLPIRLAWQGTRTGMSQPRPVVSFEDDSLLTHRQLVARLATGDRDAMELLYQELCPVAHGVVRRILEDPEDAREAVQDTFIKVWQQAQSYRPERGEVVSWLVLIARNVAIDRVRRGARQQRLQVALEREWSEGTDTPSAAETWETTQRVDHHLRQLTAAQRRALELAFFSGYSHREISSTLRMPLGTVKNHLRRGLAKLRQLVSSHDQSA